MRRIQDEFIGAIAIALFALSIPTFAQPLPIQGKISKIGDATHLEFEGLQNWKYETEEDGGTVTLTIPAFDEKTLVDLQTWSDGYIKQVTVDKNGPDGSYIVKFQLASKEVEMFDYLTDEPSRVILDFYQRAPEPAKPVVQNPAPAKPAAKKVAGTGKTGDTAYKKVERQVASTELMTVGNIVTEDLSAVASYPQRGIFDGGDPDYSRFEMKDYQVNENSIIASEQNIYIRFPYLQLKRDRFAEMMKDRPEYEVRPKEDKENQDARLLLTLHQNKRFASFVKVYGYFLKKYPNSEYQEIVRNLGVEMFAENYMLTSNRDDFDNFRANLKFLIEKFPKSPLDERNRLLLGYSALRYGEALDAVREFESFLQTYPSSEEKDLVNLARAEAYLVLRKPAEATKILKTVETESANEKLAAEAAYRLGDVHMEFKEYKQAAAAYEAQLEKYPKYKGIFPNAQYNLSESYFWQKQYKKSLDSFIEYLKLFPSHNHGGFALTRVGELLDILGADQRQVMGAFVEGYFRFPKSEGSDVARVRMLTGALRNMKGKQRTLAFKEISEIEGRSKLPQIEEFVTLLIAEGLSKGKEYQDSLARLEKFYQANPTSATYNVFRGRILRNIADLLKAHVDTNDFIQALDLYGKYTQTWLKRSDRIDTEYLRAKAYEQAGVFAEANIRYQAIHKRLKKMSGTKEEKQRRVYEHLPTSDQVNLRMAATAVAQAQYRDAYSHLRRAEKNLTEKESVEKVQLGAEIATQSGDNNSAINYLQQLIASWKGQPELLVGPYLRLGKLHLEQKDWKAASQILTNLENLPASAFAGNDVASADKIQLKADLNLAQGNKEKAVEAYLELLSKYEGRRPMESIRYKAGEIKFEIGDIKGAEQIWSGLQGGSSELYAKMAEQKLKQSQWEQDYKKYIDRIPAAEQLK